MKFAEDRSDLSESGGRPCLRYIRQSGPALSARAFQGLETYLIRSARLSGCCLRCAIAAISASDTSCGLGGASEDEVEGEEREKLR